MHSRFAVRAGRLTAVASSRSRGRSCRLECANSFEAGDRLAGWSRADSSIGPYSVTNTVYLYAVSGCTTGVVSHVADGTERRVEYTWTDDYRLAGVSVDGATVAEYAYDVLGNLVAVANDEESFEILVDNGHSLADVAADGRTLRVYMRAPGVDNWLGFVDMTGSTPVPYFYVTDHLGSVLAVTDANGNLVERYEYDAWGKVLSVTDANGNALTRSSIGNRILWQAREYSWTTGLYYFRNRWYDPTIGRWISKDPIGINGGINLYQFCAGNPVCCRDPSGWCTEYGNPQEEKNKIKALRNGWNGTSLPYAIMAGVVMHGNGVGEYLGLSDRPEWPRMDYATQKGVGWKFEDTIRRNDMMGNYMAGYAAGYSDYPTILYLGVRTGGVWYELNKKNIKNLKWDEILTLDADSVPDILQGFTDGSREFAKDHPFRSAIRAVTTPKILPVMLFLDSLY